MKRTDAEDVNHDDISLVEPVFSKVSDRRRKKRTNVEVVHQDGISLGWKSSLQRGERQMKHEGGCCRGPLTATKVSIISLEWWS